MEMDFDQITGAEVFVKEDFESLAVLQAFLDKPQQQQLRHAAELLPQQAAMLIHVLRNSDQCRRETLLQFFTSQVEMVANGIIKENDARDRSVEILRVVDAELVYQDPKKKFMYQLAQRV